MHQTPVEVNLVPESTNCERLISQYFRALARSVSLSRTALYGARETPTPPRQPHGRGLEHWLEPWLDTVGASLPSLFDSLLGSSLASSKEKGICLFSGSR